jgi:CheY-like chemotaxis protein
MTAPPCPALDRNRLASTTPRSPSALVVDDERTYATRVALALSDAGFSARYVFDGTEALALLSEWQPDVLVLDIRMRGIDGLALLAWLRCRHDRRLLPVVLVTGDVRPSVELAALAHSADALLHKPVPYDEIVRCVNDVLDRRRRGS